MWNHIVWRLVIERMYAVQKPLLCLIAVSLAGACGSCPAGTLHFKDSCYFFSNTNATWTDATSACHARGSHLAVVETPEENSFLTGIATARKNSIWLDGTDAAVEGRWVWSITQTQIENFDWDEVDGEPDGARGQNCLAIYKSNRGNYYKWYDIQCQADGARLYYVCETEKEADTSCSKFLLDELIKCKQQLRE